MAQLSRKHFRKFATLLADTCPEGHNIWTALSFEQAEENRKKEEVKLWDRFHLEINEFLKLSNPRFSQQVFDNWIESKIKEKEDARKEAEKETERAMGNALAEEMRKTFAKLQ